MVKTQTRLELKFDHLDFSSIYICPTRSIRIPFYSDTQLFCREVQLQAVSCLQTRTAQTQWPLESIGSYITPQSHFSKASSFIGVLTKTKYLMAYSHVIASNAPVKFNETEAEDYYFPIDLGGMELSMDKPAAKHHSVESIFALSYESKLMLNGGNELFDHNQWMTESTSHGPPSYFTHSLSNQHSGSHFSSSALPVGRVLVTNMDGVSSTKTKRKKHKRPTRFPVNGIKLSRFVSYDDTDEEEEYVDLSTTHQQKAKGNTQDIPAIHAKWRWSRSTKRLRITYPLLFNLSYEGDEEFDLVLEGLVIHLRKGSMCVGVDLEDNSIRTVRNAICESDRWGFDLALPRKPSKITEQPFEATLCPNTTFITPSGCKVHLSSGTGIITPSGSSFFFFQ